MRSEANINENISGNDSGSDNQSQEDEENISLSETASRAVNYGATNIEDSASIDFLENDTTPIYRPTAVPIRVRPRETYSRNNRIDILLNFMKNNKKLVAIGGITLISVTLALIIHAIVSSLNNSDNAYGTSTETLLSTQSTLFSTPTEYSTYSEKITTEAITRTETPELSTYSGHSNHTDDPRCIEIPICCDEGTWICNKM